MNKEVSYCKRCGRRLKDPISKERGFGPTCFLKTQQEKRIKPLIPKSSTN